MFKIQAHYFPNSYGSTFVLFWLLNIQVLRAQVSAQVGIQKRFDAQTDFIEVHSTLKKNLEPHFSDRNLLKLKTQLLESGFMFKGDGSCLGPPLEIPIQTINKLRTVLG